MGIMGNLTFYKGSVLVIFNGFNVYGSWLTLFVDKIYQAKQFTHIITIAIANIAYSIILSILTHSNFRELII